MSNTQKLLGVREIRSEFGFGRDLATALAENMPHVVIGRRGLGVRRKVHRADFERVMAEALAANIDLWQLVKQPDARAVIQAWLTPKVAN